jgi:hypothetical protein
VNTAVRAEQLERDQALGLINADAERSMLARLSPRRNPWREIATFDEQVAELERQKATIGRERQSLTDKLPAVELDDKERLAAWMDTQRGERPIPAAPRLRERLEQRMARYSSRFS